MQEYLNKIRSQFPRIDFKEAVLVEKGWDNDVVILDESLVFRFPKRASYEQRFQAEVKLLKVVVDAVDIRVPDYQYLASDMSFGGYPIIRGKELTPEVFTELSDDLKRSVYKVLGQFLTTMHSLPLSHARNAGFEESEDGYWWSEVSTRMRYKLVKEKVFPLLSPEQQNYVRRNYEAYLNCFDEFDLVICHGDLSSDHIFVDDGQVSGIIDFADVDYSDPAIDFTCFWYYGQEFVEGVLNCYGHKVNQNFLERSKMPYLMHATGNILEILEGASIPLTIERCKEILQFKMESGLTIEAS